LPLLKFQPSYKKEALTFVSTKIGLKVNVAKTKCVVVSRVQNAGRNHRVKIDNSC